MTSQYGKRTIEKHILPNVSRRKGNQTMKFCQLKEYSMRNIFLENHTKNVVEKVFPETFLKNQNWTYLWINSLNLYAVCFYCMQVEGYRNILKLCCRALAFTFSCRTFLKVKKRKVKSQHDFWRKIFFLLYSINWQNLIAWLFLLCEIYGNMCVVIVC